MYSIIRCVTGASQIIFKVTPWTGGIGLMKGRSITYAMMLMALFAFTHTELRADVAVLPAALDTTLFEDVNGRLGNGAGQYLFIGRTWDENGVDKLLRRALIKFDLDAIPDGSAINSASFGITIDQVPPAASSFIMSVHTVTGNWGEGASNAPGAEGRGTTAQVGDATWLHRFYDSDVWNTPGGDFAPEAVANAPVSSEPQSVTFASSPQLVAAVQAWVDDPASNHGWILRGDEISIQNARRVLSRENAGPGNPLLTIEFTPPPPVAIPAMTFGGLLVLVLLLQLFGLAALSYIHNRQNNNRFANFP